MRRIYTAIVAVLLMMLYAAACCEEPVIYTYDFGDFSIDLEEGIYGAANDKVDGGVRLVVMPGYSDDEAFHDNMNLVWQNTYLDLREADIDEFTSFSIEKIQEQMEADGVALSNLQLLESGRMKHDGMRGMYFLLKANYEYASREAELDAALYTQISMFSDEYLGTYIFTLTARTSEAIEDMRAILDTIVWN